MLRILLPLAVVLTLGLTACGGDETASPSGGATTSADVTPTETSPETPAGTGVPPAAPEPVLPTGPNPQADAVGGAISAVVQAAPALESYYRGAGYPQTLDEAVASLPDSGVTIPDGFEIGGYTYDPDAVEFVLCVQAADGGAWASYDTAPMGVSEAAPSGGCPQG